MTARYGSLPFKAQIDFFRNKVNVPTAAWDDVWQSGHDTGFMVAGAAKADLLADLYGAMLKAHEQGTTLAQFRKDFDAIVAAHGWTGWTGEGSRGGRAWRTRVIYETNLRTSHAAGRWQQLQVGKARRPWLRYIHDDSVVHPRPHHVAWDGLILHIDDPWWQTHYPPNGWGCKCSVQALSDRDLAARGIKPDEPPESPIDPKTGAPEGIDKGWAYAPGASIPRQADALREKAQKLPAAVKQALLADIDAALAPRPAALPAPRTRSADRLMPADLDEQAYAEAFLQEFGVAPPERETLFEDVTGELLTISDALFRDRRGDLKIKKRGRERFVRLLADTIKVPDEIWEDIAGEGQQGVRRRYVARWLVEGRESPALAVFETDRHGWSGVTAFEPEDVEYLQRQGRRGRRVYRRGENE